MANFDGSYLISPLKSVHADFLFLGIEDYYMKKLRRLILILLALFIVALTLLYLFISPIAKYTIEKNCVTWTGRKITLDKIKINALNGSVYLKNIKIYEANGDTVFFDCHDIYLKVNLKKMLSGVYEVDKIKIDTPEIRITQNGNNFNFDDLVKRFSSAPNQEVHPKNASETQYYLSNVIINNANITYTNIPIHNVFRIHQLNFNLPELAWDKPESKLHLDFNYGIGGFFNIDLDINRKSFAYNLSLLIEKYDLSQYYAPLNSLVDISSLKGQLTTKLRMHGKFNSPTDFSIHGVLDLNDVEINDRDKRKFFAIHQLSLDVDSVDIKHNHYDVNHLILDKPYVAFDVYPKGNNFSSIIKIHEKATPVKDTSKGKSKLDYSNIFTLLSSSVKAMGIDFLSTNYHADSIAIFNGEFAFNDYTPKHNFHYNVTKFNLVTSEINDLNSGVIFHSTAQLGDSGKFIMRANLSYNHKKKLFNYKVDTLKFTDLSPIAKYVLEKNSVKWTGREITTGAIKVNVVKGSIYIKDIKMYEPDSSTMFFSCHDVYMRIDLMNMLDNVYHLEKLKIENPYISIVQNGNNFNFDDLVKRFSSPPNQQTDTTSISIHYVLDSIMINHAAISYNNQPIHNVTTISNLNLMVPHVSWDDPVSQLHLDFVYGSGGLFNIDMDANRNTLKYNTSIAVSNYDLSQYYAPLNSFINISSLKGVLNTKIRLHGKFNHPEHVSGTGYIHINDLEIDDSAKQKVFALGELALNIDTINVKHTMFYLNNVILDKPFVRFDYYTKGNNISQMIRYGQSAAPVKDTTSGEIKPDYSNIFTLLASSAKLMSLDLVNSNYHTDSITIRNGQFLYNDYTLNTPFHYNITDLDMATDKLSAVKKSIQFNASATLNDTGKLVMSADIGIDLKNMLINYSVSNLRMSDLNPYMEYYIGVPFIDGYMNYQSTDSVINRNLKSSNHIHISGIVVGKKTTENSVYHVPVRTAVSLLKDEKGNIELTIPANGNLDDPNYKIGPLVGRIMSDLIVKTAESPFKFLGRIFDKDKNPEDLKQFYFDYMQDKLAENQISKLEDIYKVLDKKKELNVEIIQDIDSLVEKDELALFLAKKQYYDETNHLVNDSLLTRRNKRKEFNAANKVATQDTLFDRYLNKKLHLTGNELMTVEDKCIQLVGDSMLSKVVHNLVESRNREISEYLLKKKGLTPERFKILTKKDSLEVEDADQPKYKINYTAEEK